MSLRGARLWLRGPGKRGCAGPGGGREGPAPGRGAGRAVPQPAHGCTFESSERVSM